MLIVAALYTDQYITVQKEESFWEIIVYHLHGKLVALQFCQIVSKKF